MLEGLLELVGALSLDDYWKRGPEDPSGGFQRLGSDGHLSTAVGKSCGVGYWSFGLAMLHEMLGWFSLVLEDIRSLKP